MHRRSVSSSSSTSSQPSPRRRGRPPLISDEKILETARNVFLERGIRATTVEVADRAGISEGTIFHRFKSKDALFRAAMRVDPESSAQRLESLMPRVGEPDLRAALVGLGNRVIALGRVVLPVAMMSWSNPSGDYSLEKLLNKQAMHQSPLRSVCAFLEAEMDAKRLARSDVQVLARAFLGSMHHYCMTELLHQHDPKRPPAPVFVEGLVDLLFRPLGSAVAAPPPARKTSRRGAT